MFWKFKRNIDIHAPCFVSLCYIETDVHSAKYIYCLVFFFCLFVFNCRNNVYAQKTLDNKHGSLVVVLILRCYCPAEVFSETRNLVCDTVVLKRGDFNFEVVRRRDCVYLPYTCIHLLSVLLSGFHFVYYSGICNKHAGSCLKLCVIG